MTLHAVRPLEAGEELVADTSGAYPEVAVLGPECVITFDGDGSMVCSLAVRVAVMRVVVAPPQ